MENTCAPLPGGLRPVGLRYTPAVKTALDICFSAHRDQKDKGGLPYVFHPFHLAEQMDSEAEICAALLHDVVEDTAWTLEDLRRAGIPQASLEAIACLTRDPAVPYLDYVAALRKNPIARKVKLADLRHNSDPARLPGGQPDDAAAARLAKYRAAIDLLLSEDPAPLP